MAGRPLRRQRGDMRRNGDTSAEIIAFCPMGLGPVEVAIRARGQTSSQAFGRTWEEPNAWVDASDVRVVEGFDSLPAAMDALGRTRRIALSDPGGDNDMAYFAQPYGMGMRVRIGRAASIIGVRISAGSGGLIVGKQQCALNEMRNEASMMRGFVPLAAHVIETWGSEEESYFESQLRSTSKIIAVLRSERVAADRDKIADFLSMMLPLLVLEDPSLTAPRWRKLGTRTPYLPLLESYRAAWASR